MLCGHADGDQAFGDKDRCVALMSIARDRSPSQIYLSERPTGYVIIAGDTLQLASLGCSAIQHYRLLDPDIVRWFG